MTIGQLMIAIGLAMIVFIVGYCIGYCHGAERRGLQSMKRAHKALGESIREAESQ